MSTPRQDTSEEALLERLLAIDSSLEVDDPERALALCEEELGRDPKSSKALALKGECLDRLERREEAAEAFRLALKHGPKDLFALHAAIDFLLGDPDGDPEATAQAVNLAQRGAEAARQEGDDEERVDFLLAQGIALNQLGESARALVALDAARDLVPGDVDVIFERAYALFQLCRFADAQDALERTLTQDPEHPGAHQYLGLIAERAGDDRLAERHFERARQAAPEDFLPPVVLSQEAFDRAIEEALEGLPRRIRKYLENVPISVEEIPAEADLVEGETPLSPEILGLFQGTPVTEQSVQDPWSLFPSSISLYQRNLQRCAGTRDELIEEIGITLVHEVGHFLGLDEDELYLRGLD